MKNATEIGEKSIETQNNQNHQNKTKNERVKNATEIGEKSTETHEKTSENQPNDQSPKQTKTKRVKKATEIGEKSTETHEKPMKISVKLVANGRAKDQEAEPSGCNHSLETFPPNDCN